MSARIRIDEHTSAGLTRTLYFGRDERKLTNLDNAVSLEELTLEPSQVYDTGLGALPTIKRLRKILARIAEPGTMYVVKSEQYYRVRNGAGPGSSKLLFGGGGGRKVNKKYG